MIEYCIKFIPQVCNISEYNFSTIYYKESGASPVTKKASPVKFWSVFPTLMFVLLDVSSNDATYAAIIHKIDCYVHDRVSSVLHM